MARRTTLTPDKTSEANVLASVDFTAAVTWADLTRLRKTLGVANLGHLGALSRRPVAAALLESGRWGDCWLTMLQLGDTSFRIVITSDRPTSDRLDEHLILARRMITTLGATLERLDTKEKAA